MLFRSATGAGATAVRYAEAAVELASESALELAPASASELAANSVAADSAAAAVSARHQVKSEVVLAAALCSAGAIDRARVIGDAALAATGRFDLLPLRWALTCLLGEIGSDTHSADELRALRHSCADRVRRAGGNWCRA